MEQARSQARLIEVGVQIVVSHAVESAGNGQATLSCVFSARRRDLPCGAFVPVTSREPNDALWHELQSDPAANAAAGIASIQRIGDCKAPGLIAHAVYDGHRTARRIDGDQATSEDLPEEPPFRRDRVVIPPVL
jgi:dimethylamine/trimethylamine dehydrogenase